LSPQIWLLTVLLTKQIGYIFTEIMPTDGINNLLSTQH